MKPLSQPIYSGSHLHVVITIQSSAKSLALDCPSSGDTAELPLPLAFTVFQAVEPFSDITVLLRLQSRFEDLAEYNNATRHIGCRHCVKGAT